MSTRKRIHFTSFSSSEVRKFLEIDTPMFNKIERGYRRAKREQVLKLAEYLHQDEKEMFTVWLDKFIDAVEHEQESKLCNDAIRKNQGIVIIETSMTVLLYFFN